MAPNRQKGKDGGGNPITRFFSIVITLLIFGGIYVYAGQHVGSFNPYHIVKFYLVDKGMQAGECLNDLAFKDGSKCKVNMPGGSSGNPGGVGSAEAGKPANTTPEVVTAYNKALDTVRIGDAEKVDYKRTEWAHWSKLDGNICNTRVQVLKAQAREYTTKDGNPDSCSIIAGTWLSVYDGAATTVKPGEDTSPIRTKIQIDHVIPLKYAAEHGGQSWDAAKKEAFANDTTQLIAVSATSNTSKGAKGPAAYMPQQSEQCHYSQVWIDTANKYNLSITKADKEALKKGLATCGS